MWRNVSEKTISLPTGYPPRNIFTDKCRHDGSFVFCTDKCRFSTGKRTNVDAMTKHNKTCIQMYHKLQYAHLFHVSEQSVRLRFYFHTCFGRISSNTVGNNNARHSSTKRARVGRKEHSKLYIGGTCVSTILCIIRITPPIHAHHTHTHTRVSTWST